MDHSRCRRGTGRHCSGSDPRAVSPGIPYADHRCCHPAADGNGTGTAFAGAGTAPQHYGAHRTDRGLCRYPFQSGGHLPADPAGRRCLPGLRGEFHRLQNRAGRPCRHPTDCNAADSGSAGLGLGTDEFIGDKNHPEVKGIISFGKRVTVCNDLEELQSIEIDPKKEYCLLTQTTLNKKKLEKIKSYLENSYQNVKILDKVCGATQVRQEAVEELAQQVDMLIVVGGKTSSNTKKLYDISISYNPNTYLIQDENDLKKEWFEGKNKIGITAGASTPEEIVIKIENQIRGIH